MKIPTFTATQSLRSRHDTVSRSEFPLRAHASPSYQVVAAASFSFGDDSLFREFEGYAELKQPQTPKELCRKREHVENASHSEHFKDPVYLKKLLTKRLQGDVDHCGFSPDWLKEGDKERTPQLFREALGALAAYIECSIPGPIKRSEHEFVDFIDGNNEPFDIKTLPGLDIEKDANSVIHELLVGQMNNDYDNYEARVVMDTSFLNSEQYDALWEKLADLSDNPLLIEV